MGFSLPVESGRQSGVWSAIPAIPASSWGDFRLTKVIHAGNKRAFKKSFRKWWISFPHHLLQNSSSPTPFWSICSVFSLSNSAKRNSYEVTQVLVHKYKVKSILKGTISLHCANDVTHYLCYSLLMLLTHYSSLISQALILVFLPWDNQAVWFWLCRAHKSLNLALICCCTSCVTAKPPQGESSQTEPPTATARETFSRDKWQIPSTETWILLLSLCTSSTLSSRRIPLPNIYPTTPAAWSWKKTAILYFLVQGHSHSSKPPLVKREIQFIVL